MKRIGIFYHPLKDAACSLAKEITRLLREKRLAVWLCSAWEWENACQQMDGTDLILSIGGDGTILRAAQAVMPRPIPIAGINMGRLGFMSELRVNEIDDKLPLLLDGQGYFDERSILDAEITSNGSKQRFLALNDVVIARGGVARLINVKTNIDGEVLTTLRVDGVVLATATGCTGYALAAGGPILHPHSSDIVMVPLLPHLSFSYPMVLPGPSVCKMTLEDPTPGIVSVDGHISPNMGCGDVVTVRQADARIRFVRIHEETYYGSLEQKLKGRQSGDASF